MIIADFEKEEVPYAGLGQSCLPSPRANMGHLSHPLSPKTTTDFDHILGQQEATVYAVFGNHFQPVLLKVSCSSTKIITLRFHSLLDLYGVVGA